MYLLYMSSCWLNVSEFVVWWMILLSVCVTRKEELTSFKCLFTSRNGFFQLEDTESPLLMIHVKSGRAFGNKYNHFGVDFCRRAVKTIPLAEKCWRNSDGYCYHQLPSIMFGHHEKESQRLYDILMQCILGNVVRKHQGTKKMQKHKFWIRIWI